MSNRTWYLSFVAAIVATVGAFACGQVQAAIVGPYTVDANTMHLFHFDETSNPIFDDPAVADDYQMGAGSFNGGTVGTLGHASYDGTFGTAGRTNRNCCGNSTGIGSEERGWEQQVAVTPANLYGSDSTAFTIDMMLKFNQTGSNDFAQIIRSLSADLQIYYSTSGGNNFLNFKVPGGAGTFISSPLTIDTSKWYHAAFVYDGVGSTTDNVRIYFTEMDPSATEATLVNTFSTGAGPTNYSTNTFWIGGPSGGQANALYDELRISNVARAADGMMFSGAVPEPSSFALAGLGLVGLVGWGLRRRRNG